jgi:alkylated DNA repair dioxygenase AlkB
MMMLDAAEGLSDVRQWDLDDGGRLSLRENWLAPTNATEIFAALLEELDWKQRSIRIFGREVLQPRLTAWYGDAAYTYSGVTLAPLPWTPLLSELRERLIADVGERFNSVLCNLYRTGADSMGLHSDDEKELGPRPVIASVSLGAARRFVLRHKGKKAAPVGIELTNGSLLVMGGATQAFWKHEVPKEPSRIGARINLTFRYIVVPSRAARERSEAHGVTREEG